MKCANRQNNPYPLKISQNHGLFDVSRGKERDQRHEMGERVTHEHIDELHTHMMRKHRKSESMNIY